MSSASGFDADGIRGLMHASTVSSSHFGMNFVADFESIGDRPWDKYDEVAVATAATTLRYPGGSTAENGFDISNPNATQVQMSDGSIRSIMGAYDFANYCLEQSVQPIYIIPTVSLFENNPTQSRQVTLKPGAAEDIRSFVINTLIESNGTVATYEIGNEYETYMSARQYADMAELIAPIIQDAIDDYKAVSGLTEDWEKPSVAMQLRTVVANADSTLSHSDLMQRAINQLENFDHSFLDSIDELTTHIYSRVENLDYQSAYRTLDNKIAQAFSIFSLWNEYSDEPIEISVSEWAANHKEVELYGLAQVPFALRMFHKFVQSGADSLNFWSAQYHGTSLALNNGTLTATGALFSYLSKNTDGLTPIDPKVDNENGIGSVAFLGSENGVLFVSNLTEESISTPNSFQDLDTNYQVERIGFFEVDTTEADGAYRSFNSLSYFNEPDLPGYINWIELDELDWSDVAAELTSYQTMVVELSVIELGTEIETHSEGSEAVENFVGSFGIDSVSYENAPEGVEIDLIRCTGVGAWVVGDTFTGIEAVEGSDFDDLISGSQLDNVLNGNDGDDIIWGHDGDDFIFTGSGNDTVYAGTGDDKIVISGEGGTFFGDDGDDTFESGNGSYAINGGDGFDTLSFVELQGGVDIWHNHGVGVGSSGNEQFFSSIEAYEGSHSSDRATFHEGKVVVELLGGDDKLDLRPLAEGQFSLGDGDDSCISYGASALIDGGSGDDFILSWGGATIVGGEGNDEIICGGDTLVFNLDEGKDMIRSFDLLEDTLVFEAELLREVQAQRYEIVQEGDQCRINFDNGGEITFVDMSAVELSGLITEMYV